MSVTNQALVMFTSSQHAFVSTRPGFPATGFPAAGFPAAGLLAMAWPAMGAPRVAPEGTKMAGFVSLFGVDSLCLGRLDLSDRGLVGPANHIGARYPHQERHP